MNSPLNLTLDKASFLKWVAGRQGRYELKGHRVMMMAGGTRNHARLIGRFVAVLGAALDPEVWSISPSDWAVEIGEDVRYPDVVVERASGDGQAMATAEPALVRSFPSMTPPWVANPG